MADLSPEELLQIHKDYADEFAALAQSGLVGAFNALSDSGIFDYHPALISINTPNFGTPNRNLNLPKSVKPPSLPTDPTADLIDFVSIPNDNSGSAPSNTLGSAPLYNSPTKPSQIPSFTAGTPTISTALTLPGVPAYLTLPALTLPYPTVNIPTAPTITQPIFDGQRPSAPLMPDASTLVGSYTTEQAAHRNMLPGFMATQADAFLSKYAPEYTQLRSRINNAIIAYTDPTTGGGAGIPTQIELAIGARASDKNAIEFQRALETSTDTIAKQGWTIPPGALLATLREARMSMGDAQVRSNTDIATKNFELEQQNFQFMFKLGEALEEKMMATITEYLQLALKIDELSISSAKELIATYLGVYNLQVMIYKGMLEGYTADAEVYKTRIAALEMNVRLYEAQIKAELAKTEIDKATVEILQAVASVNQTLAQSYKAQVEAATATLEVARLQLAVYESQVRGFAAQVSVYEAQWRGYEAEVNGEVGKMRGFEAQASAYTATVNGYRAAVESYAERVRATAAQNGAIAGRNEATVKIYTAQADVAIKNYEGLVAGYTAESNAVIKQADIEVEYWRTTSSLIMQEYTVAINQTFEYAREQMNLFRGQMEAAISAGNGLAQAASVAGGLASSAMNGLTSFAGKLVSSEG